VAGPEGRQLATKDLWAGACDLEACRDCETFTAPQGRCYITRPSAATATVTSPAVPGSPRSSMIRALTYGSSVPSSTTSSIDTPRTSVPRTVRRSIVQHTRLALLPITVLGNLQNFLTGTGGPSEISSVANAHAGVGIPRAPRWRKSSGGLAPHRLAPWKPAPRRNAKSGSRRRPSAPRRRAVKSRLPTQRIVLTNQLVRQHWTRIVPDR
jgi:hypothetical protein